MMENPFEEKKVQRPTLLIVLCVLTFIGSGWSVLSNLFSMFTAGLMNSNMQMEQYSNMAGQMEDGGVTSFLSGILNSSMEVLQVTIAHANEIAVMGIVLSVISLLGAVMMFQLKRLGFYLYTASQILALFILPYFAGFSIAVLIGMLSSGLFAILFIILYAVNLKYMNR
ncbi:MAG: hypothetical protein RR397_09885 [Odoribacter sp.]